MKTPRERRKAKRMAEHAAGRPITKPIRCPDCGKPATATIATGMARCPRGHDFKWEDAA